MKNKFLSFVACCLSLLLLFGALPCAANSVAEKKAGDILEGILPDGDTEGIQEWINTNFADDPESGVWYALALSQNTDIDFSQYEESLLSRLAEIKVNSASSRLKYALCFAAVGSTDEYILKTLEDSTGKQGLMSWVFGLHLLNNGYSCEEYTAPDVRSKLLALQCEDGGWAIMGKQGDADATAMTVQALAPYYQTEPEVKEAIDKALFLLSSLQLSDGDYVAYGVPNPESTAQVIVALSSLGIDAENDQRFIKNGKTLFDGIEKYRLSEGGFCHVEGGEENLMATMQVLCASVAYLRMIEGKTPLYILDKADPNGARRPSGVPDNNGTGVADEITGENTDVNTDGGSAEADGGAKSSMGYKPWAALVIVGIGVMVCFILVLIKKRNVKNFLAVALVCAMAIAVVFLTDFRSAEDYYNGESAVKENAIGKITMTIRCDTVAGRAEHIPQNGIILDSAKLEIAEGDSVYTVLTEAARKYKIQIENNGDGRNVYISGIANLYEFDYGDLSGWEYYVNGERTSVGAGEYKLRDGDVVEWRYTTALGEDLK